MHWRISVGSQVRIVEKANVVRCAPYRTKVSMTKPMYGERIRVISFPSLYVPAPPAPKQILEYGCRIPAFHEACHVADPFPHGRSLLDQYRFHTVQMQPVGAEQSTWPGTHHQPAVVKSACTVTTGETPVAAASIPNKDPVDRDLVQFRRDRVVNADIAMLACIDTALENTIRAIMPSPRRTAYQHHPSSCSL
jgi:hypothetical protein